MYLIVDQHPTHRAKKVKRWLAKHSEEIELFYLPPYSPERNPDEYLNQNVKANAVGRHRARDLSELVDNIRSYLRNTQRRPRVVQRFFTQAPFSTLPLNVTYLVPSVITVLATSGIERIFHFATANQAIVSKCTSIRSPDHY